MRLSPALALLAALGLVLATAACGKRVSSAEAVEFNNALVKSQRRLVEAGDEFAGKAVKALQGGSSVDVAITRRAYESAIETMDRVHSDVRIVQVPATEAARRYYDEFQRSLKIQDELIRMELGAILKAIEDPTLNAQARGMRVSVIATRMGQAADSDFAALKAAQAEFARAHRITLK